MKRFNHISEEIKNIPFATHAVWVGTKKKRGKKEVAFLLSDDPRKYHELDEKKVRSYATYLTDLLKTHSWVPKKGRYSKIWSKNRTAAGGKWRDIYVPVLDDHIISHMLTHASFGAMTRGMHPHCCGSVKKRGIAHIIEYVSRWARYDKTSEYFVKLDIKKFFQNITKEGIREVLEKKIKDKEALYFWDVYLEYAPSACPVGYYPSPYLANLYLEDFDHFVEEGLYKIRRGKRIKFVTHYLRYSDDMVLFGSSKSDLRKAVREIKRYLYEKKGLKIKDSWEIKKIGRGSISKDGKYHLDKGTYYIDIGGYKFSRDVTIMRDGVYFSFKDLIRKINRKGYFSYEDAMGVNAKLAWAEKCDSNHFFNNEVLPNISINQTRRVISYVEKKRERF